MNSQADKVLRDLGLLIWLRSHSNPLNPIGSGPPLTSFIPPLTPEALLNCLQSPECVKLSHLLCVSMDHSIYLECPSSHFLPPELLSGLNSRILFSRKLY